MEKSIKWSAFCGYLTYIWKEKKILYLFGVLFFPMFIAANFLQIYLPKMIIRELEEKRTIVYMGGSILCLVLVMMCCIIAREKLLSRLEYGNRQIRQKAQNNYINKHLYVDYHCLEDKEFLSLRNRVKLTLFGGGVGEVEQTGISDFMENLVMITAATGNVIVYLYYLQKLSIWLIVLLFADLAIGTIVNMRIFRKNESKYGQSVADSWQKLDYVTRKTQDFSMAKDVRLYHMDSWLSGRVKGFLKERLSLKKKELGNRGFGDAIYIFTLAVYQAAVFGTALVRYLDGEVQVSDVVFYFNMVPALYTMLDREVSGRIMYLLKIITEFQKFQSFITYGEDTGRLEVPVHKKAAEIKLEHVSFSYPKAEKEVLHDINLTVSAGDKVAIVGVNGAGKTTLMKLVCGLLHPTSGRILLNGVDMETMEAEERYAWFSCTFQDVQFLPVSIRENISQRIEKKIVKSEENRHSRGDDERVWNCLEQAGIKREVAELPVGLDTLMEKNINENAIDFSGGQRQKLILARALYRDAGTLILDEPTAALDALAEYEIYSNFDELVGTKTAVYISHRLSSCQFCNDILVIDEGRAVQRGNHEELVRDKEGLYYILWNTQAQYYQTESSMNE